MRHVACPLFVPRSRGFCVTQTDMGLDEGVSAAHAPRRHLLLLLVAAATILASGLVFPAGALAHPGNVWWSSEVAEDDLRWKLAADRRTGVRLACNPVERSRVWSINYRHHECWAGWGNSRTWYRTAYLYHATVGPGFYAVVAQPYGLYKVGKKWRRVVHVRGHHIQKCKSSRRPAARRLSR